MDSRDRLIVALDVPTLDDAERLAEVLVPTVSCFKVGSELFTAVGPPVLEILRERGLRVFLDLKFHDIPNTVAGACRAAVRLGASMLNMHASGGAEMLATGARATREESERLDLEPPSVLAVTVLTSLDETALRQELGVKSRSLKDHVLALAQMALGAGCDGLVASPEDVGFLRKELLGLTPHGHDPVIVTPGIRPAGTEIQDQKRIATPAAAIREGADYLVVGRPITQAERPREAAEQVIQQIEAALRESRRTQG
jgi:orotidine-5'-phosphate decarboxylase